MGGGVLNQRTLHFRGCCGKKKNKEKKELDLREKRMVTEAAESTWKMIDNSDNPEDFRYFLEQFPDSPYAIPAKLKLKQLERVNQ